ncbi:tetratricopeptide repeat protein [Flavobacteriaceae bacterium]|jgi:tetratricopeptide (TPR) repeat protein|nr:tetratricopeptide repeat protein [Flavobacteriaceae bacterium]MDB2336281.1 tetratricopeptide repeat protein [Flavobacteriaceae bacterium]MDB2490930.1 tetratricopeptide repeat protein [Flavobacteriaceae bacterium]
MKNSQKIGFLSVLLFIVSCSTKKDAFLNRNYNALTTQYNILYNGGVAFDQGLNEINLNYEDDFFELLPIEPLSFENIKFRIPILSTGAKEPGIGFDVKKTEEPEEALTPFDIAEQKAVKAIQKHSMNINGKERNKKIDDAYLLLGKSRYYTERFIPAIDAYNYIIANYPNASLINETKIWRAKAHIRIENEELAIETLEILLRKPDLPDFIREDANTALAMAYAKLDSVNTVRNYLWEATKTSKNKTQRARNLFVLGQLYSLDKIKDTASMVFKKLINFKQAPYKFRIHAEIELAKNAVSDSSSLAILERYKKLIKNRDNRPYLDAIYYQVAVLEQERDSLNEAVLNYNKSLRAKNGGAKQKTYSYEQLAKIYFKDLDYVTSGAYYDSILQVANNKNTLRIKRFERRAKNLSSLVKYEKNLQKNDSILTLAALPKEQLEQYFQEYIDKIKKEDEELAQKKLNQISFGSSFGGGLQSTKAKGKWYFYNTQSLGFGKSEFKRVWGSRPLEDNWRISDKSIIVNASNEDKDLVTNIKNPRYEISTYLETVPSSAKELDSLTFDRNTALFELGLIYKEQFKNPPKATRNLERLLVSNPDKELILPANYHLYQLYLLTGNTKATQYKDFILNSYPDSPFSKIILNPEIELSKEKEVDEDSEVYEIAYKLYKDDFFEDAICFIDMTIPTLIEGSILVSKFELLKAYAIGKYQNKDSYIAALEKVAVGYPQTEQGKKALEIMKRLK